MNVLSEKLKRRNVMRRISGASVAWIFYTRISAVPVPAPRFRARASFSTRFNRARNRCHLLPYFSLLAKAPTTPLSTGNRPLLGYAFTATYRGISRRYREKDSTSVYTHKHACIPCPSVPLPSHPTPNMLKKTEIASGKPFLPLSA